MTEPTQEMLDAGYAAADTDLSFYELKNIYMAMAAKSVRPEARLIPEGWKLAPIKPTEKMLRAGLDSGCFEQDYPCSNKNLPRFAYEQMIAAVPPLPQSGSEPKEKS